LSKIKGIQLECKQEFPRISGISAANLAQEPSFATDL
jgi:hypothetical protein